jgi:hypothetical protein
MNFSKRTKTMHAPGLTGVALALLFVVPGFGSLPLQAQGTNGSSAQTLQQIKTVFVIAMENHNFTQPATVSYPQQLLGNPAAPFLNSLITPGNPNAAQVSFATQYFNVGTGVHPSEPNYIWAEAGTGFGVATDADPSTTAGNLFAAPHLTAQLNAAGIPWKDYQEDLEYTTTPAASAIGASSTSVNPYYGTAAYFYAAKHNPMAFFTDTQTQNVYPLTNLFADLTNNNVGRYNWITPNMYNDMHSALSGGFTYHGVGYAGDQAAIAENDNFLATIIPTIMASPAYQSNGVIILRWDETEGGDDTNFTIPEIIISPLAKGNAYASSFPMCHSSDLKTMEEIFGLPFLTNTIPSNQVTAFGFDYNNVAAVNDLGDMFQGTSISVNPAPITGNPPPALTPPSPFSGRMVLGGIAFQLSFAGPAGQTYELLASDNPSLPLSAWTLLTNGSFTGATNLFPDFDATNHRNRFYTLKSP